MQAEIEKILTTPSPLEKMLNTPDTLEMVGIKSVNTLKRLIIEEGFPAPYEVMRGRRSFAASEVQAWIRQRMAEQRGAAA